jgi:hypothetical protein
MSLVFFFKDKSCVEKLDEVLYFFFKDISKLCRFRDLKIFNTSDFLVFVF